MLAILFISDISSRLIRLFIAVRSSQKASKLKNNTIFIKLVTLLSVDKKIRLR
jgi:hypothetical protein